MNHPVLTKHPDDPIVDAISLLLTVLAEHDGTVAYSFFYDGTVEKEDWLRKRLGLSADEDHAEPLMDEAAEDLKSAGYATLKNLESLLSDGHHDYQITLTEDGRKLMHMENDAHS